MAIRCKYKYILFFWVAMVCFMGLAGCKASSNGEEKKNATALESRTGTELQEETGDEDSLEETEEEVIEISQETLADKVLSYTQSPTESLYFLMATEISYEGKMVRINEEDTGSLLDLFQNITVEKMDGWVRGESLYTLLLYDETQTQGCMIEVYDGWVGFNWRTYYKTSDSELVSMLDGLYAASEELKKLSPEEVLLSSRIAEEYGFTEDDIFYINGDPALLFATGYGEMPPMQGECNYKIYYTVEKEMYFNEIGTAYQMNYYIEYYDDGGEYIDNYIKIWNHYDYVTNEWGFIYF